MATSKIGRDLAVRGVYIPSTGTATIDLIGGSYLIVIAKVSGIVPERNGMYILSAHNSGNSSLTEIKASSVATLSFSYPTLTVTTTINYMQVDIILLTSY